MKASFFERVIRDGIVDTYTYRYRTREIDGGVAIDRIRRREIGKIDEDDMWETVVPVIRYGEGDN